MPKAPRARRAPHGEPRLRPSSSSILVHSSATIHGFIPIEGTATQSGLLAPATNHTATTPHINHSSIVGLESPLPSDDGQILPIRADQAISTPRETIYLDADQASATMYTGLHSARQLFGVMPNPVQQTVHVQPTSVHQISAIQYNAHEFDTPSNLDAAALPAPRQSSTLVDVVLPQPYQPPTVQAAHSTTPPTAIAREAIPLFAQFKTAYSGLNSACQGIGEHTAPQMFVDMPQHHGAPTAAPVPSLQDFPSFLLTPHLTIPNYHQVERPSLNNRNASSPFQQTIGLVNTITPPSLLNSVTLPKQSYTEVVRPPTQQQQHPNQHNTPPFLPDIPISYQAPVMIDGIPSVSFSDEEMDLAEALFMNSLVIKFSGGNPALAKIREAIADWDLSKPYSVGIIDSRHVLVRMICEEDLKRALSIEVRKIDHRLFRSFRWTPSFSTKVESSLKAVWVHFPSLPFTLFAPSFIARTASTLGNLLDLDVPTKDTSRLRIARACVEVDLASPLLHEIKIKIREKEVQQPVEYETNTDYCSGCHLHGHTIAICRKRLRPMKKSPLPQQIPTSNIINPTPSPPTNIAPLNTHIHIASPQTIFPTSQPHPSLITTAPAQVDGCSIECSDSSSSPPSTAAVHEPSKASGIALAVAPVDVACPVSEGDMSDVSNGDYNDGRLNYDQLSDPLFQTAQHRQRYAHKKQPSEVEHHGNRVKERRTYRVQQETQGSKVKERQAPRYRRRTGLFSALASRVFFSAF